MLQTSGYRPVSYTHLDVYKRQGADDEDNIVKLINLIDKSDKTDEILGALRNLSLIHI